MADTTHELSILARARDEASGTFRNIGNAGKRAMDDVGQSSRRASDEVGRLNANFGRAGVSAKDLGSGARRALAGVTAGIAAGSAAAQGFQKNILTIGSVLATSLASGGPAGLAIAGIGLGIGIMVDQLKSGTTRANELRAALDKIGRVEIDALLSTSDQNKDLKLQRRAIDEGSNPDLLKRVRDLDKEIESERTKQANAQREARWQEQILAKPQRSYGQRLGDFYKDLLSGKTPGSFDSGSDSEREQAKVKLAASRELARSAEERASELGIQRDLVRGNAAAEVTKELEKQLRFSLAQTDTQKLLVQLEEQRKEVIGKSLGDPKAEAMFDELASRLKQRQRRSDEDAFRSRIDPIEASTAGFRSQGRRDEMIHAAKGDPAKVAAAAKAFETATQLLEKDRLRDQLAKSIRDANGDTVKIQEAQAIHAASIANLTERTKNADAERKRNAQDLLLSMEEQLEILGDSTGEVEKRIRREHELKAVVDQVAGSGAEAAARAAQKRIHDAEVRAEQRGTQGQYTGGGMDKGLATARARRRKAMHEEKYASGGWAGSGGIHDTFDMQGNVIYQDAPGGGVPNRGDFNGLYGPQNTAGPGSRGRGGRGPGTLTPSDMGPGRDRAVTGEGVSYVHRRGSESDDDVLQKLLRANAGIGEGAAGGTGGGGDVAGAAGKVAESAGAGAEASKAAAASLEGAKVSIDATKDATDQVAAAGTQAADAMSLVPPKLAELGTALTTTMQAALDANKRMDQMIQDFRKFMDGFGTLGTGG